MSYIAQQFQHRFVVIDTHNSRQALEAIADLVIGECADLDFGQRMFGTFSGCELIGCDEADLRVIENIELR
jgi:hypothetical protein